jgi:hypothetical protein
MNSVEAAANAGKVRVMVTNFGIHSPEYWANETARGLIVVDPEISDKRGEYAEALRAKVESVLVEAFRSIRATSPDSEIWKTTLSAHAVILRYAARTPWEREFANESIAVMMRETIFRNLRTAADLAVRTE